MTAPSVLSHIASAGPEFLPAAPRRAQRTVGFGNSRQSGPQAPEGAVLTFDTSTGSAGAPFDAWTETTSSGPFGGTITVVNSGSSTFEAWIRTTATAEQTIFAAPNGGGGALAGITIVGDRIQVYWGASGAPAAVCDDTTPVSDGRWHHVAVTFDSTAAPNSSSLVTFYKDGIGVAGAALPAVVGVGGSPQLGVGFGSSAGFVGTLYDVRWWTLPHTQLEIATQRFTPPPPSQALAFASTFDRTDNEVRNRVDTQSGFVTGGSVVWAELPSRPTFVLQLTGDPEDCAAIGGPVAPVTTDGSTFECWLKMSTNPGVAGTDQNLLAFGPGLDGAYIYYSGQQTGPDTIGTDWRNSAPLSVDTRPVSDGGWHHVAVVFDRGSVTFYKDGVPTTESLSMPAPYAPRTSGSQPQIGAASEFGNPGSFNGYVYDARIWSVARQIDEIQSFMYATLNGDEQDLAVLCNFNGADAALPDSLNPVNEVTAVAGSLTGSAAVVVADLPIEPLPTTVWSIPLTGISPIGPKVDALGLVCAETVQLPNGSVGAQLTSVDIQSATVNWTWPSSGPMPSRQAAPALATGGGMAWIGVQDPGDPTAAELYGVSMADGSQAWDPVPVEGTGFCTGLVPGAGGVAFITIVPSEFGASPDLYFVDSTGTVVFTTPIPADNPQTVCDPVISGDSVYTVSNVTVADQQQAILTAYSISGGGVPVWDPPTAPQIPFWVSAALAANGMIYVVGNGGSVLAFDATSGTPIWVYPNGSGTAINSAHRPVVVAGALYIGGTDGNLYALDANTGAYLWQVDTGSTIITDLIAEDTVVSFANQGDGRDTPPTFFAVDTVGGGQDVLTYPVPAANTILSAQGAVNGVVYFYGEQTVYAVNMDNLTREFRVETQLIVEDYDTTPPADGSTSLTPMGTDTSFRVTLTLTDELQYPRAKQAVKLWASGDLYITNYLDGTGNPLHIGVNDSQWLETDSSGTLALAISAYDDGVHGGSKTSTPLLVCPALLAWSNFMGPQESIVIYPDHDHLASLSNVQGSAPAELADTSGPQPLYLDQAYGYDTSSPMVNSDYQNANDYGAIAQGLQNIVGNVDPTTLNAVLGSSPTNRRYLAKRPMPNVAFRPVGATSTQRQYVPVNANFTMTLAKGSSTFTPGVADLSRPDHLPPAQPNLSGLSDFDRFVTNVVKGAEQLAKVAWQDAEAGLTAALHSAEDSFTFAITCLEDAVTVCVGFLKSVVNDIRQTIQWLSALFDWEHIVANHNFLKQLIANPNPTNDPTVTTGVLQQLQTWVSGSGALSGTLSTQMKGQAASSAGTTGGGLQGSTAQSSAGPNTDPQAALGSSGAGSGGQSTWMQQKFQENSGMRDAQSGTPGGTGSGASIPPAIGDSDTVVQLMESFVTSVEKTISQDFSTFPAQLEAKLTTIKSTLADPKSLLGTGFADILAVFTTLADDLIDVGVGIADDFATLVAGLISEMIDSLTQPLNIPFISDLWKKLTGDQLTVLDMLTLLMAVPATVLIAIITGSAVAPGELETTVGLGSHPWNKQDWEFLFIGLADFTFNTFTAISDGYSFWFSAISSGEVVGPVEKVIGFLLNCMDVLALVGSLLTSLWANSRPGGSAWEDKDWAFWAVQFLPVAVNYAYVFWGGGANVLLAGNIDGVIARDLIFGVIRLIFSAAWCGKWPGSYRDAPGAPGLVIASNLMGVLANLSDIASIFGQWDVTVGAKVLTGIVGAGLTFGGFIAPMVVEHA